MKKSIRWTTLIILLLSLSALVACGDSTTDGDESAATAETPIETGSDSTNPTAEPDPATIPSEETDPTTVPEEAGTTDDPTLGYSDVYPTMPGATDIVSFGGLYSYNSTSSREDLVAFYQTEMLPYGFTVGEDFVLDGELAILEFINPDGATVAITVTPVDGVMQVLILGNE